MGIEEGGFVPEDETIDLTEDRIGSLYAALGNNEAKAITFLAMKPGVVYDDADILTEVRRVQGNTQKGWRMGNEGPFHYLQKSFAPVGLVAQEVTDAQDNKYGYVRTPWGNAIGTAFAGKLLQLSYKYPETSLYDIFGSTISTSKPTDEKEELKKRSPLNRIYLFRALLGSGDQAIALNDLAGKMDEQDVTLVHRHLKDLARVGIVEYDNSQNVSIVPDKKDLLYKVVVDFQHILDLDPATLEEGKIFASSIMANPDAVAALMKKAKEHSRNANQLPIEQTAGDVAAIIESNPGITTIEVRNKLEEEFDHALSEHRVRRIIKYVMKQRGLPGSQGARNIRWSFNSD
ncbi:MAG: hypothetical protein Q7T54_03105 [Candidatus Levybacteria bacterium]|nr:hypothetical protein [Candidatus Levybacteria bacterium]